MAELIVVSGPPGAGKSTVARILARGFPASALVPGDDFFGFVTGGRTDPWLPEAAGQNDVVLRAAAAAAGGFARGGYTVVYDGVVGPWFLRTFAAATGLAHLHYVVLLPPEEECVARVAARADHGFTDETATRRMHREFARAHLDARHRLVDAPADARGTAGIVLDRLRGGTLRHQV